MRVLRCGSERRRSHRRAAGLPDYARLDRRQRRPLHHRREPRPVCSLSHGATHRTRFPGDLTDPGHGVRFLHRRHSHCGARGQVLGAIAQFEKTSLVAKLKAARDRKKAAAAMLAGVSQSMQTGRAPVNSPACPLGGVGTQSRRHSEDAACAPLRYCPVRSLQCLLQP